LRHIGFICFQQQKIEFSKDEVLKLIEQSKIFCIGLSFNESDLLDDLLKAVPLFTQDGNYYRWAHKSLHEYFAAQFIYMDSKEKQNDILLNIYNHPELYKFLNILDLYYDMDYKTFRNVIEYNLLKDYYEYNKSSYNKGYDGVSDNDINERKQIMFNFIACNLIKSVKSKYGKELWEYIENLIPRPVGSYIRSITHDHFVITVCDNRNTSLILELLANKKDKIVQDDIGITHLYEKLKSIIIENKPYEITDSKDSILNHSDNFKDITNYLFHIARRDKVINHNIAINRYEEIKTSIEAEKNDDLLIRF
jgi:hypothetical protein